MRLFLYLQSHPFSETASDPAREAARDSGVKTDVETGREMTDPDLPALSWISFQPGRNPDPEILAIASIPGADLWADRRSNPAGQDHPC